MVWALVQAATSCLLLARSMMPETARPTAPIASTQMTSKTRRVLGLGGVAGDSEDMTSSGSGVRGQPDEGLRRIGFGFIRIGSVRD